MASKLRLRHGLISCLLFVRLALHTHAQGTVEVTTAEDFQAALDAGARHIRLTDHLVPTDARPQHVFRQDYADALYRVRPGTVSIRGDCQRAPSADLLAAQAWSPGMCVVHVPGFTGLYMQEHKDLVWLDHLLLVLTGGQPPDTRRVGVFVYNDESDLALYMTNVTVSTQPDRIEAGSECLGILTLTQDSGLGQRLDVMAAGVTVESNDVDDTDEDAPSVLAFFGAEEGTVSLQSSSFVSSAAQREALVAFAGDMRLQQVAFGASEGVPDLLFVNRLGARRLYADTPATYVTHPRSAAPPTELPFEQSGGSQRLAGGYKPFLTLDDEALDAVRMEVSEGSVAPLGLPPPPFLSPPSGDSTPPPPSPGLIAGCVVGTGVLVALAVAIYMLLRRRAARALQTRSAGKAHHAYKSGSAAATPKTRSSTSTAAPPKPRPKASHRRPDRRRDRVIVRDIPVHAPDPDPAASQAAAAATAAKVTALRVDATKRHEHVPVATAVESTANRSSECGAHSRPDRSPRRPGSVAQNAPGPLPSAPLPSGARIVTMTSMTETMEVGDAPLNDQWGPLFGHGSAPCSRGFSDAPPSKDIIVSGASGSQDTFPSLGHPGMHLSGLPPLPAGLGAQVALAMAANGSLSYKRDDHAERLEDALDHLHTHDLKLAGRWSVLPFTERRLGGQGLVQFVRDELRNQDQVVKFFFSRACYEQEAALYTQPGMRDVMAAVVHMEPAGRQCPIIGTLPAWIVLERGSSLSDWAAAQNPDLLTAASVLTQILQRLHRLHAMGYAHRDIKPANILWRDAVKAWTLIDFGCVVDVTKDELAPLNFSLPYAAPEVIHALERGETSMKVDTSVDIWSLGIVVYELLSGTRVFSLDATPQEIRNQLAGRAPLPWECSTRAERKAKLAKLGMLQRPVLQCLSRDWTVRPTAQQLLQTLNHIYNRMTTTQDHEGPDSSTWPSTTSSPSFQRY